MAKSDPGSHSPLLSPTTTNTSKASSYGSTDNHHDAESAANHIAAPAPSNLEDDVLPETSTLGRTLTWRSAYILTVSRVLGSGIFATPGSILAAVGSPGLALLLWLLGALVAYCGLAVSLEYGCMLPRSGGEKVYLEFTYRRPKYLVSVVVATQAILLGFTASNCIVFARYVLFGFGYGETEANEVYKYLAVALLTAITVVHAVWMRAGIAIQDFLGWIKIVLIGFMILSGPLVIIARASGWVPDQPTEHAAFPTSTGGEVDWSWDGLWAGSIWSWGSIATSFFKVYYSYVGLSNVNNVLNEVKDPVRTLRSVTISALFTVGGMYLLANVAYLLVVPVDEVKNSGELIAALFFERVFGDTIGRRLLPLMVALSAAGNVMVVTFAMARLNQEIGRTGLLPGSRLLSSTAPFGSPLGGLIVHYIPSLLVITIPTGDVYSFILEVEGYPAQIFSFAIAAGLLWLRYRRPELDRPYRAWLPTIWVRIVLAIALLLAPFFPSATQKESGGLWGASYALVGTAM